jgi:hypothetical protein
MQPQAALADRAGQRVGHRGDQRARAVADADHGAQAALAQHRGGVPGDPGRDGGVGRVGQVVPEGELDPRC